MAQAEGGDKDTEERTAGRRSLASSAAMISAAAALSRVTGFVRVLAVASAMGTTFLANTYQTANTAPNLLFELVAAGVLTSVFVPTFVSYIVKRDVKEGWAAASVLTSVALVWLVGLGVVLALAAPLIMRLLTVGVADADLRAEEIALGSTWLRLFAPQIVFYGAGMIMTAAMHAHRRFGLPAIGPILNNIVVIGVYLTYAAMRGSRSPSIEGITSGEVFLLGAGTTAGVIAMTLCSAPALYRLGWRFRFRFQPRHPAVRKAVRLGAWALGYAGGYQAGLIVVLLLANRIEGGVAAYQWAFTFFFVPHALFAVPVFHALFPAMSEHAVTGETPAMLNRLRDGLAMLAFVLVPLAAFLVIASGPLTQITLNYGVMTDAGARLVGRVLGAFALGLPCYSTFLVTTRAFYAVGDAKTPALVNAGVIAGASAIGAALFLSLSDEWAVAGLAAGHSIGFAVGSFVLARAARRRFGAIGSDALTGSWVRAVAASAVAAVAMGGIALVLDGSSQGAALLELVAIAAVGAAAYLALMVRMRSPEAARTFEFVRARRR
jgi:putative peptidoglycan lipid II flippase